MISKSQLKRIKVQNKGEAMTHLKGTRGWNVCGQAGPNTPEINSVECPECIERHDAALSKADNDE